MPIMVKGCVEQLALHTEKQRVGLDYKCFGVEIGDSLMWRKMFSMDHLRVLGWV